MIQPKPPENPVLKVINCRGEDMSVSTSWTSDVWEYVRLFRLILKWLDFCDETIDKALPYSEVEDEHEEGV